MNALRACLKIAQGAAARDFGCGQGGEVGASPNRAVTTEPTPTTGKRPAARRVFEGKAVWLCCSLVGDPPGIFSFVAPRHPAFPSKTSPRGIFRQALKHLRHAFFQHPDVVAESVVARELPQPPWRFVHILKRQPKRAVMHRHEPFRA